MFRTIAKASLIPGVSAIIRRVHGSVGPGPSPGRADAGGRHHRRQQKKSGELTKYEGTKAEKVLTHIETTFITGMAIHPFFDSALAGGGFTLGAGYRHFLGSYNTFDVRGSITLTGYKRIEAQFLRRASSNVAASCRSSAVGAKRPRSGSTVRDCEHVSRRSRELQLRSALPGDVARLPADPQVPGLGATPITASGGRARAGFGPFRRGSLHAETLPGLGTSPIYLHVSARAGFDSRTSPGYTRTGGYYGVEGHEYFDPDGRQGFKQANYTAIQHIPILRNTWVLSLRGEVETTVLAGDQTIPFFMLPALGGGSSLRGFSSWRFRDRNSLLLSGDFRDLANNFLDMALFYDAGKVASDTGDLNLDHLKSDYGIGFRIHGPAADPLRIEFARSNEGLAVVFSAKAAF